ncbi:hypothetical protein HX857_30850 [Pseudomonas gingeri]|uniref:hypothetical protein n=1 Tax=Pseudomonas gingeri TaxID=117681 RepID=UPI0015C10EC9|nr:hypothetical protein [Pseudomonas gingeri]NWE73114.1 hypothetical protein [Pseudomonas gingeri]
MPANEHEFYLRFHTPDARIIARDPSPMLPQEQAWARYQARVHTSGWLEWLILPLVMGTWLPALLLWIVLSLYQWLLAPDFDPARHWPVIVAGLVTSTLLLVGGWVAWNRRCAAQDPRLRYWQAMPEAGEVELEQHRLVSAISLWSNDFDPDRHQIPQWIDGQIREMPDSGISEWVLARTVEGRWLVLRQRIAGTFRGYGTQVRPTADRHWQLSHELAIVFAPRTNLSLGMRCSAAPLLVTRTDYWQNPDELARLTAAAHHWTFFAPDRYAVVNPADVPWIEALVARARVCAEGLSEGIFGD